MLRFLATKRNNNAKPWISICKPGAGTSRVGRDKLAAVIPPMIRKTMPRARSLPQSWRATARELKSLMPWLLQLAQCTLDTTKPFGKYDSGYHPALGLYVMYHSWSWENYSPADLAAQNRMLLLLQKDLEKHFVPGLWKAKPKFHMAQELRELDVVSPSSLTWGHCDEDYAGSLSKVPKQRWERVSRNTLTKLVVGNSAPTWPVD